LDKTKKPKKKRNFILDSQKNIKITGLNEGKPNADKKSNKVKISSGT